MESVKTQPVGSDASIPAQAQPELMAVSAGSAPLVDPDASQAQQRLAVSQSHARTAYDLDEARSLDPVSFPNPIRSGSSAVPCTIANVAHLLTSYGITVRYNTVKKRLLIDVPGYAGTPENAENAAIAQIVNLATLNRMPTGQLLNFVELIGDRNAFNPVTEWIQSRLWDGDDRLPAFYDTLVERSDYPVALKQMLLKRWLLSATAAAVMGTKYSGRGVLTLQGPQSIGKTRWGNSLVPAGAISDVVIKLDHHLDAGNKDSLLGAINHWIVEIGELDSSFRKDVARLKGFLTRDSDGIRRPYAKVEISYPRRTVFYATVNDENFLIDSTGNSRWWTIPITKAIHDHGIDMQQLFAQLAQCLVDGEQWWLTPEEEVMLEKQNKNHRSVNAIHERLHQVVDTEADPLRAKPMTTTQLLAVIDIRSPSNLQCKQCAEFLREHFGESRRIHGNSTWRVPLRKDYHQSVASVVTSVDDSDEF